MDDVTDGELVSEATPCDDEAELGPVENSREDRASLTNLGL